MRNNGKYERNPDDAGSGEDEQDTTAHSFLTK